MTAYPYATHNEKAVSGALALLMHGMFFALIVFGVTLPTREPPAILVDLWSNLPPVPAPKVEPPPPPPRTEVKPAPKPEPVPKADIQMREKKEKALKARERELAEKKKREEQARLKQQQATEAEAQRLAREQEEALRTLAAQQAAAQAKLVDEYKRRIAERIKRFIVEPPNLQGNPEVELNVIVLPGGDVLEVRTRQASGQATWDIAVERAVHRAQPLPLPPDPALMREFRELNLRFRPKE